MVTVTVAYSTVTRCILACTQFLSRAGRRLSLTDRTVSQQLVHRCLQMTLERFEQQLDRLAEYSTTTVKVPINARPGVFVSFT